MTKRVSKAVATPAAGKNAAEKRAAKKPLSKKTAVKPKAFKKPSRTVRKIKPPTKNGLLKMLLEKSAQRAVPKTAKKRGSKAGPAKKIAAPEPPVETKPRRKVIRAISSARFRGVDGQYDFKVYAINEIPRQEQAVYIISRRVTDRRKRGHHKLVCIGQTDSVRESLKKHKKEKCIKQNDANVICIMAESDEQKRRRIEADLKAAHTIACNRK